MGTRISAEKKLLERCSVLANAVRQLKLLYSSTGTTQTQRDLLETMIGAAISYMPQPKNLWTGKISVEALTAERNGEKTCKDHNYPRKVAGRELLELHESELTGPKLVQLYKTKYGLFNKVTPVENKRLVQHQRAESLRLRKRHTGAPAFKSLISKTRGYSRRLVGRRPSRQATHSCWVCPLRGLKGRGFSRAEFELSVSAAP